MEQLYIFVPTCKKKKKKKKKRKKKKKGQILPQVARKNQSASTTT
jgi:hypothetical protein